MKTKLLIFFLIVSTRLSAQVKINEIMAANRSTVADESGDYSDWIELYNTGNTAVDLAGYYLTDTYASLTKFRFTASPNELVIPANGYLLIWASSTVTKGIKHAGFSLSASGEQVALVLPNGVDIVDSLSFGPQRTDVSYGRLPNGGNALKYFASPTPSAANVAALSYDEWLSPPVFSHKGGFYGSPFSLTLTHPDSAVSVYYTTDGSEPNPLHLSPQSYPYRNEYPAGDTLTMQYRSQTYAGALVMEDASDTPNKISTIATTHSQVLDYLPTAPLYKGRIIRAIAVKAGAMASEIESNTYFFSETGKNKYSLPVISVMTQEDGFFSYENGIYVPGVDFVDWRNANPGEVPNEGSPANYLREGDTAERAAHFEIIEADTVTYKQNIGVRIHGSWSRGFRFKTLRFYGTNRYPTIERALFPNLPYTDYKTFLLRNAGNDYNGTFFRDAFIHESVAHLKTDIQAYRPAVLFLNGEYWGIHNLRQRQDKHYYKQKYGVDSDSLAIIENGEVQEGSRQHYDAMIAYVDMNDMSVVANYDYVKTQMDVENFTDYQIAEIYYNNVDWGIKNIRYWRLEVPYRENAPYGLDGRWRWSLYDTDASLSEWTENTLASASAIGNWWEHGYLLGKLLQNQTFQVNFINRFADLLNTAFLPSRLTSMIELKRDKIRAEIPAQLDRWKTWADTLEWIYSINNCISFVQQRPAYQTMHLLSKFGLSGSYSLTVNVSDTSRGYVKINTIAILPTTPGVGAIPYPWTGQYFKNIPVQLQAHAKSGYQFKHWSYNSLTITDSTLTVNPDSSVFYTAVFEQKLTSSNPVPTAAILGVCGYSFASWSSTAIAGTSPPNMKFVYMTDSDPGVSSTVAGFTNGAYDLTSGTRINGLGSNGISFVNTGGGTAYPGTKLGGAILALNTEGKEEITIKWTGRTRAVGARQYGIRLQYRIGDLLPFADLPDTNNEVIEYNRGIVGDSAVIEIKLPSTLLNKPYIQLLWRYYWKNGTSGNRDELAIDDIVVTGQRTLSGTTTGTGSEKEGRLISTAIIDENADIVYEAKTSIELKPGFVTRPNSLFKAQINGCP
ncbi:MAG: CotH kinase family protein [Spirosomataceae bacterium]